LETLDRREPSDILMTLANPKTELHDALAKSALNDSIIGSLLSVLAKAFTCNSQPENLNKVLVIMKETKFFDTGKFCPV